MIDIEATCPVCNNALSVHEEGAHPVSLELVAKDRCWICKRRESDVNVSLADGRIVGVCPTCWERGQDDVRIPLDMEEDDDDR